MDAKLRAFLKGSGRTTEGEMGTERTPHFAHPSPNYRGERPEVVRVLLLGGFEVSLGSRTIEERLRWEDVDLETGTLWVRHTLSSTEGGRPVFGTTKGTPLDRHNLVSRSFKPLLEKAGLLPSTRFHDLRHTAATLLTSRNVNPMIVQEVLGHASISITLDLYSHAFPGMKEQAASAMEDALS
jgi:hypothetical protein